MGSLSGVSVGVGFGVGVGLVVGVGVGLEVEVEVEVKIGLGFFAGWLLDLFCIVFMDEKTAYCLKMKTFNKILYEVSGRG